MKVVAGAGVGEFVHERGGRLFVWTDRQRCCAAGVTYLSARSERPPDPHVFRPVAAEGFELLFDGGRLGTPGVLNLEVRGRRRKHVEAYWDGCVFVV
jgi:hypothetical protein